MVISARAAFDRQLHTLLDDTLMLGSMVEKAIERSIDALVRLDAELARQVIEDDGAINARRYKLEEDAVRLIATQQPMAGDLRLIASVIHISTDLERIGDYAAGIAKIVLLHGDQPPVKPLIDIPRMAELGRSMLRRSLDALVRRDIDAARLIVTEDDQVDALYDQIYRELLVYMIEDPKVIHRATWLLWAAHNVERIADRSTNICERVVYMVTGQNEDLDASTY
jgi:phosphate transport system protein